MENFEQVVSKKNSEKSFLKKPQLESLLEQAKKFYQEKREGEYFKHAKNTAEILFENHADGETIIAGLYHHFTPKDLVGIKFPGDFKKQNVEKILEKLNVVNNTVSESNVNTSKLISLITQARDPRAFLVKIAEEFEKLKNFENRKKILDKKFENDEYVKKLRGKKKTRYVNKKIENEFVDLVKRIEVFIPIAHALNYYKLVTEMENEKFKRTNPDEFNKIKNYLEKGKHEEKLKEFQKKLLDFLGYELKPGGLIPVKPLVELEGFSSRLKLEYKIFTKMKMRGVPLEKVHDIKGIRVILGGKDNNPDAVLTLANILKEDFGFVLAGEKHLPHASPEKDYVTKPKENGYKAYHLIGFMPGVEQSPENIVELQILSKDMHENNEYGTAHKFFYEQEKKPKKLEDGLLFLSNALKEAEKIGGELGEPEAPLYVIKKGLERDFITVSIQENSEIKEFKVPRETTVLELGILLKKQKGVNVKAAIVNRENGTMFLGPNDPVQHGDKVELSFKKSEAIPQEKLREIFNSLKTLEARKIIAKNLPHEKT